MTHGHSTTTLARPRPGSGAGDHTRLGTRVIDEQHQLVRRRPHRWVLGLVGFAIVCALGASLFVLPVQAWLRQEDDLQRKQDELAVLVQANRELGTEVDHLQTPEGAKEAARDELGVVGPGEERLSMLPEATGPLPLPGGWPYDTISQIVIARQTPPTP